MCLHTIAQSTQSVPVGRLLVCSHRSTSESICSHIRVNDQRLELFLNMGVCATTDGSGEGRHDWPLWTRAQNQDPGQWHAGCAALLFHVLLSSFAVQQPSRHVAKSLLSNCNGLTGQENPLFSHPGSEGVNCWGCRNALYRAVASGDGESHAMQLVHCLTTMHMQAAGLHQHGTRIDQDGTLQVCV